MHLQEQVAVGQLRCGPASAAPIKYSKRALSFLLDSSTHVASDNR